MINSRRTQMSLSLHTKINERGRGDPLRESVVCVGWFCWLISQVLPHVIQGTKFSLREFRITDAVEPETVYWHICIFALLYLLIIGFLYV